MEQRQGKKVITVAELAEKLGAQLHGNGQTALTGVNTIDDAQPTEVGFVTAPRHVEKLETTKAAAVIVFGRLEEVPVTQLVVDDVNAALITTLNLFAPELTAPAGIHPRATVEESAVTGQGVSIGAGAYIAHGAKIGDRTVIGPGCSVGENTTIGANCRIDSNVVVYHGCRIGNNCVIMANTTIGATGFGYVFIDGQHRLIPHNGGVVVEDCVDIGANCCIDRAKFGNTVIGAGTKIDNLVQIAHNVTIGKCCIVAGQVGMAGSSQIGNGVVVAGKVGIREHIKVGDGTRIGAGAVVLSDVGPGQNILGIPAIDAKEELRIWVAKRRLPDMARQLKKMAAQINKLDVTENGE